METRTVVCGRHTTSNSPVAGSTSLPTLSASLARSLFVSVSVSASVSVFVSVSVSVFVSVSVSFFILGRGLQSVDAVKQAAIQYPLLALYQLCLLHQQGLCLSLYSFLYFCFCFNGCEILLLFIYFYQPLPFFSVSTYICNNIDKLCLHDKSKCICCIAYTLQTHFISTSFSLF